MQNSPHELNTPVADSVYVKSISLTLRMMISLE